MKSVLNKPGDRLFLLILFAAVVLQLLFIPSYTLKMDQAQKLYLARDFWAEGSFPVYGIVNSLRAFNPPFVIWLFLFPVLLVDHTVVLILPALVLNSLALYTLFILGRRYLSVSAGIVAAAMYAFLPRGIYFGHSSWTTGLQPHLYIFMIYLLAEWLLERKKWPPALLLPLASWMIGFHWGALITLGVIGGMALIHKGPVAWRPVLAGMLVAAVLWVPFLVFEHGRGYADLLVPVRGPLPMVAPQELGSRALELLGPVEEDVAQAKDESASTAQPARPKGAVDRALYERFPRLFEKARYAYWRVLGTLVRVPEKSVRCVSGVYSSLYTNFRPRYRSIPVSGLHWWIFLGGLVPFLGGLAILGFRAVGAQREERPSAILLLMSFFLPSIIQNMSKYSGVTRPDVAWILYGAQILIGAAFIGMLLERCGAPVRRVVCGLLTVLLVASVCDGWWQFPYTAGWFKGEKHPQKAMTEWIARDAMNAKKDQVSIRYDTLPEIPNFWVVSFHAIKETYYTGAAHDYILLSKHGIENIGRVADGWAVDPDYIVLEGGLETAVVADVQTRTRMGHRTLEPERFPVTQRDRFLEEHGLARSHGEERVRHVLGRATGDVDELHLRVREHLADVEIRPAVRIAFFETPAPGALDITSGDDPEAVRSLVQLAAMHTPACTAQAGMFLLAA